MAGEAYVYTQIEAPDFRKEFNDKVAAAYEKKKEKDDALVDAAKKIKPPTSVTMYGSHKRMLTDWADYLNKNLDDFTSSAEGMVKFERQLNMYNQFLTDAEAYYGNTYGSEEDDLMKNTFMSTVKANADKGLLEKDGVRDLNEFDHYTNNLKFLDRDLYEDGSIDFTEGGIPQFRNADGEAMSLSGYQFDDTVFMRDFQREKAKSGYDLYNDLGSKIPHKDRGAAENWTRNKIANDPAMAQRAARKYAEDNDVDPQEVMNDPEMMQAAADAFVQDAGQAWEDRNNPKADTGTVRAAATTDTRTTEQKNISSARADRLRRLRGSVVNYDVGLVPVPDLPASYEYIGKGNIRKFPMQTILEDDIILSGIGEARIMSIDMPEDIGEQMVITYFKDGEENTTVIDQFGDDANTINQALEEATGKGIDYLRVSPNVLRNTISSGSGSSGGRLSNK